MATRVTTANGQVGAAAVVNFTIDAGTAPDRFVMVYAAASLSADTLTGVTIDGVAVTPQLSNTNGASKNCYLAYALAVAGTGLVTVSLTFSSSGGTKYYLAVSYTGVASIRGTPATSKASGTAPSITVPTVADDLAVMLGWDNAFGSSFTAAAPAVAFMNGTRFGAEEVATGTSTIVNGTMANSVAWLLFALAIVPAATGVTLAGDGTGTTTSSAQLPPIADLAGTGSSASTASGQIPSTVDLAADGSASTTGAGQFPPAVDLAGDGSSGATASGQMQAVVDLAGSGTSYTSASGVVGIPSIITAPLKNNTGSVLASTVIPKVGIYKLSDMTLALAFTSQTTDASGRLYFESITLVIGDDYLVVTSDATGAAVGVSKNTAA